MTIVASLVTSLIVGYFSLQASLQPIQLQISATQTAESRIALNPTAGVIPSPTAGHQQGSIPQQTTAPSISQDTYNLPTFFERYYLLIALWVFIAIANRHQRELLLEKVSILLGKQIIFKSDNTSPVTLYPREFLEQIALGSQNILELPSIRVFKTGLRDYIKTKVQSSSSIFFTYIFRLFLFLFFLLGVMSATADSLKATFISYNIPGLLTHFEIGFFGGSIFAPMVGLWTIVGRSAATPENSSHKNSLWQKLTVFCSLLLVLFGIWVVFIMSLARYDIPSMLSQPYDIWMKQVMSFTGTIIIPLNNLLASIVVLVDAFTGLIIVISSLVLVLFTVIMSITFGIITPVTLLVLDVLIRITILYIYFTSFILITPIDTLVTGLTRLINRNAT